MGVILSVNYCINDYTNPWEALRIPRVSIMKKLSYIPYYNTLNIPQRSRFSIDIFASLDEGGEEAGNGAQDGVQDALDNDEQAVDDKVQGADQATEGEDQRLDELEDTIEAELGDDGLDGVDDLVD